MKISKTELAERLGVSPPRVSQYVCQGLPVLSDGEIDLAEGLKWVAANNLGEAGQRAGALLADMAAEADDNPASRAMHAAIGCFFMVIPRVAADAARQAGAPADVVEKIPAFAHKLAKERGDALMADMLDLEPRANWPDLATCLKLGLNA